MSSNHLDDGDVPVSQYKSSSHNLGQSLVSTLENTTKKESSPFSCKKVVHESDTPHSKKESSSFEKDGEELVIPGDNTEMSEFMDFASVNTRVKIDVMLPTASLVFLSKHMYEVIYNR